MTLGLPSHDGSGLKHHYRYGWCGLPRLPSHDGSGLKRVYFSSNYDVRRCLPSHDGSGLKRHRCVRSAEWPGLPSHDGSGLKLYRELKEYLGAMVYRLMTVVD